MEMVSALVDAPHFPFDHCEVTNFIGKLMLTSKLKLLQAGFLCTYHNGKFFQTSLQKGIRQSKLSRRSVDQVSRHSFLFCSYQSALGLGEHSRAVGGQPNLTALGSEKRGRW